MAEHRSQCAACPWRDPDDPAFTPDVLEAAAAGAAFVCHTRCGPCPGPALAGLTPKEDHAPA